MKRSIDIVDFAIRSNYILRIYNILDLSSIETVEL